MESDKLIPIVEEIKKWCETNDIICFHGSTQDEPYIIYDFEKESNNDWNKFLQIANKLNVKIIILEKEINNIKILYDDLLEKIMNEEDLESSLKERYKKALLHDKEIAKIKLSFHYEQLCYRFSITSEWFLDYHLASKAVEGPEDEDNITIHQSNPISAQEPMQKKLTEVEVDDIARKITGNSAYIKARSRIQKQEIIKTILKDLLGDEFDETPHLYWYWPVIRRTEEIYEIEIKPKQELEIKQKVLELKSQGLKKVEIRSKLDISQGIVDRFFHME